MIRLAEDTITDDELVKASEFLVSGNRLTKDKVTLGFEDEFSKEVGSSYSVFVNSGSSANLLIAAGLKESGRLRNNIVVCPAISWVTTVTPFLQLGFEVILCDADPTTLGVDPVALEKILESRRPSLLSIVHVLGHPNQMKRILELCQAYDVLLVEDTCEALGSRLPDGRSLGTLGIAGSFSFYYGHHISTIEGGMVTTNDFDLFQVFLSMRSHGWSRDLDPALRDQLSLQYKIDDFRNLYTFYYPGFNFRSTDLQAFIGIGQLKRLKSIVEVRERNFRKYSKELKDYWGQDSSASPLSSFAYAVAAENRHEVAEKLADNSIESRPLICGNIARHPFWLRNHEPQVLPIADWVHDKGMYLPNHANLSLEQVARVVEVFAESAKASWPPTIT